MRGREKVAGETQAALTDIGPKAAKTFGFKDSLHLRKRVPLP
jgi:hypothetical protein